MVEAPFIKAAVEQVSGLIKGGVTRIGLAVPAGAGKPAALELLEDELEGRGQVVRVDLPEGDDAGMVALALAAAQLRTHAPALLDQIASPGTPWGEKLELVRSAAEAVPGLVFLVDEPRFDPSPAPHEELFARRAIEVTETLLEVRGATVVLVGRHVPAGVARSVVVSALPWREAIAALPGDLTPPLAQPDGRFQVRPLELRLLCALAAAGVAVDRIPRHHRRAELLVEHDLGRLAIADEALRRTLLRLSVLRMPFTEELSDRLGARVLSPVSRRVLDLLLSTTADGMRSVPDGLGRLLRARHEQGDPAWQADGSIVEAHRLAAEHHREQFDRAHAARDVPAAVRHELEEIHHLTEAGDAATLLSRSLWFVDQYNALGKALSQMAFRAPRGEPQREEALRRQAIEAYERALAHDRDDAYAHHYIAYNLDILAIDPARAEREYVAARDLEPTHAWYHSRYVRFLITTAWMTEARAAWERAFDGLGAALRPVDYEELHGQVARLLLHRGELEFAREVLEDVPEELRATTWWRALTRLRIYLEEERDERLVFPPSVSMEERWVRPHLVPEEAVQRVKRWRPGRVVDRDERHVHLRVATRAGGDDQVSVSYVHLSRWRLKEWGSRHPLLPAGTFVELIEYRDGTRELKAWSDRASTLHDADLPKLFPSPDRYIRRGFAHP